MKPKFEQLDDHDFTGEPAAEVAVGPDDLSTRTGLQWTAGADELGPLRHAAVRLDDGTEALLVSHDDDDPSTVVVLMREDGPTADPHRVLAALGLGVDELVPPLSLAATVEEDLHEQVARHEAGLTGLTRKVEALVTAQRLAAQAYQTEFSVRPTDDNDTDAEDVAEVIAIDIVRGRAAS